MPKVIQFPHKPNDELPVRRKERGYPIRDNGEHEFYEDRHVLVLHNHGESHWSGHVKDGETIRFAGNGNFMQALGCARQMAFPDTPRPGDKILIKNSGDLLLPDGSVGIVGGMFEYGAIKDFDYGEDMYLDITFGLYSGRAYRDSEAVSCSGGPGKFVRLSEYSFRRLDDSTAHYWKFKNDWPQAHNGENYELVVPTWELDCGKEWPGSNRRIPKKPDMFRTYNDLYLTVLRKGKPSDFGYYYLVTEGYIQAFTAFRTREEFIQWAFDRGLRPKEPVDEPGDEIRTQFLDGGFYENMMWDLEAFHLLKGREIRMWSNGSITKGIVTTDADGICTVNYLNPNVKERPVYKSM